MICTPMGRSGSIYHIKELPNCYLLAEIIFLREKTDFWATATIKQKCRSFLVWGGLQQVVGGYINMMLTIEAVGIGGVRLVEVFWCNWICGRNWQHQDGHWWDIVLFIVMKIVYIYLPLVLIPIKWCSHLQIKEAIEAQHQRCYCLSWK